MLIAAGLSLASPSLAAGAAILVLLLLVALRDIRAAVFLLVLMAPWTTVANALTRGRLAAIGIDLFFILLIVAFPLARVTPGRTTNSVRAAMAGAVLTAILGIGGLVNPAGLDLVGGMEGFRVFFLPVLMVPIGVFVAKRAVEFSTELLYAIVFSATLVALMGIRQVLAFSSIDQTIIETSQSGLLPFTVTGSQSLRAFSPLPGPFHFGLLMMFGILIVAALSFHRPRRWLVPVGALLLVALVLNATRLTWLGTATGVVVVLLTFAEGGGLLRWGARLLSATAIGALLVWLLWQTVADDAIRRLSASITDPVSSSSFVYRILGWYHDIFPAIRSAPWIGYGTGMAKDGLGPYTSHNLLLKLLLEGGLILLSAYLVTIGALTLTLWRRRNHLEAKIGLAILVGVHAAGMFGPVLDAYPVNLFFWLTLGAAMTVEPNYSTPK